MRKIIAWPLAWYFYYAGDLSCKIMTYFDAYEIWVRFWYPIYNRHMGISCDVQDWADGHGNKWPWGEREGAPA